MTANVLSRPSGDPEIAGFQENYSRLDSEKAKLLKNIRKDGQYLVAICDYHSGRHFEDVVMKAVFDAYVAHLYGLSRDDFAYIVDTFPVLKKKEEKAFGELMSKRKCLEEYDRIEKILAAEGGHSWRKQL